MAEITDYDSAEDWLANQSDRVSQTIASRAALRVLPFVVDALPGDPPHGMKRNARLETVFTFWRAAFAAHVLTLGLQSRREIRQFARSSCEEVDRITYEQAEDLRQPLQALGRSLWHALQAHHYQSGADAAAAANDEAIAGLSSAGLYIGTRVSHPKFGNGTIAEIEGEKITTDFDAVGTKTLISSFLALHEASEAAWKATQFDAAFLARRADPKALASVRLWPKGEPRGFMNQVNKLATQLHGYSQDWEVWTNWYQNILDGTPLNQDLELTKALIPDEIWKQGPKVLNAEIARLTNEHAAQRTPQAERIKPNLETGALTVERVPIAPGSAHQNACDKVHDRLDDLRPRLAGNQFTAMRPVVEFLDRTVTRYREQPRRVHDDFETGATNIRQLLDQGEIAEDLAVTNLQRDLENGFLDIRSAEPEIEAMARARSAAKIARLDLQQREKVAEAAYAAADLSDAPLAEELREDADTLKSAPDAPVPEGLPEGAEKTAGYRLGGRLLRIWQMIRDRDNLSKIFEGTVKAVEKVAKLVKGGGQIGKAIWEILRLLGW